MFVVVGQGQARVVAAHAEGSASFANVAADAVLDWDGNRTGLPGLDPVRDIKETGIVRGLSPNRQLAPLLPGAAGDTACKA